MKCRRLLKYAGRKSTVKIGDAMPQIVEIRRWKINRKNRRSNAADAEMKIPSAC